MNRSTLIAVVLFSLVTTFEASAQQKKTSQVKKPKKVPPAFQPPKTIDSKLPNVLIIGDSISIGYMLPLRKKLEGKANVFRPATNCGPSTRGLENIESWIGDRRWSVIQFNHGLHDLKYMGPKNQNLADPKDATSHQQVPPDEYAKNIRKLAERMKKTGAQVIFCQTTPVPEGAAGRVVGDSKKYNEIAEEVMKDLGEIKITRLYDYSIKNVPTREANVHYTAENSDKLAAFVAKQIMAAIESK